MTSWILLIHHAILLWACWRLVHCNNDHPIYSYIIVGGGTAGCVLASRLSEDPHATVLLVEAGHTETNPALSVPLAWPTLQRTSYDWQFETQPQRHAAKDTVNQKVLWSAGKLLGGSSAINAMDVMRGSPFDYDLWNDLGNMGWSYEDVLPFFEKLEGNPGRRVLPEPYIPIVTSKETSLAQSFVVAGTELGYATDHKNEMQEGFRFVQHNTFQGRRVDTAQAYLYPASGRHNLQIITDAYVTKVSIQNGTAVGISYYHKGKYHHARVSREVILSAGAVMSPFVLMHSGIGPKRHLEEIGIPVVADLPVGQHMEDHVTTFLDVTINTSISLSPWNTNTVDSLNEYLQNGTGVWSTTGLQGNAFIFSEHQTRHDRFPYIQLSLMSYLPGATSDTAKLFQNMYGVQQEIFNACHNDELGKEGFTIFVTVLHPRSTGTLKLRSKNPYSKPEVKMPYLRHHHDVADLVQGIRLVERLLKTESFKGLGATLTSRNHPSCEEHPFNSDDYWKCYVKRRSFTASHYSSSCRMTPPESRRGVLDNQLRVKGVHQLRVVDASTMPHVVSGGTMLPVMMIAEKASVMIKNDHHNHSGKKD